ncbi:MAG: hypothetical protein WCO84_01760 [bacterium]
MDSKKTNILIGVLAFIVLLSVYLYTGTSGAGAVSSGLITTKNTEENNISIFLKKISSIKNISLDKAVFENKVLKNGLQDQGRELTPEEKGRINPFAPFGAQALNTKTTQVTEVQKTATPVVVAKSATTTAPVKKVLSD